MADYHAVSFLRHHICGAYIWQEAWTTCNEKDPSDFFFALVSEDGGQDRHFTCVLLDRTVCNIISFNTFQSGCFLISLLLTQCNI